MTTFEILFFAGAAAGLFAWMGIVSGKGRGSWLLTALLGAFFAGFSAIAIWDGGPLGFVANHSVDLWGTQVWYDLIICVGVAFFLIIPRAKAAGMNVLPWSVAVFTTASIALLPMLARVLYLEHLGRADAV